MQSATFSDTLKATLSSKNNKKPLYQYRLSCEDYDVLRQYLINARHQLPNMRQAFLLNHDKAFVLYASEWWRREYLGKWRWEDLLESIGLNKHDFKNNDLLTLTEKGLRKWDRVIIKNPRTGRRNALASFMIEGGLPIAYLNSSGGWIKNTLRGALTLLAQEQKHEPYIQDQTIRHRAGSSDSSDFILLLCQLTKDIYALLETYHLDEKDDPIDYLTRQKPDWRDELPFPLDEQSAQDLLKKLITESSKERKHHQSTKKTKEDTVSIQDEWQKNIRLHRTIRLSGDDISFWAMFEITPKLMLSKQSLAKLSDSLTFSLLKQDQTSPIYTWQMHMVVNQPYLKSRQNISPVIHASDWLSGFMVKVSDLTDDNIRIEDNDTFLTPYQNHTMHAIDVNLPFLATIDEQGGTARYVGSNSQSTKDDMAVVYIPHRFEQHPSSLSSLEKINDVFNGALYYLKGMIRLTHNDEVYQLKTQSQDANYHYEIKGKQLLDFIYPHLTFKEDFKIIQTRQDNPADKSVVAKSCIFLKKSGNIRYQKRTEMRHIETGVYHLMVKAGDDIAFQQTIGVVPNAFRYKLLPQSNQQGKIIFENTSIKHINIKDEHALVRAEATAEESSFILTSETIPSKKLAIELITQEDKNIKNLVLLCHFPSGKTLICDSQDNILPNNHLININTKLYGYRIYVYNAKKERLAKLSFYLESRPDICINKYIPLKSHQVAELAISSWHELICDLMKFSQKRTPLDECVVVEMDNHQNQGLKLKFVHYDYELYRDGHEVVELRNHAILSQHHNFDDEHLEYLKHHGTLIGMNFTNPKDTSITLDKSLDGHWELSAINKISQEQSDKLGTWLISYQINEEMTDVPDEDIQNIQKSIRAIAYTPECLYDNSPKKDDRLTKIRADLTHLAKHPNPTVWQDLKELTEQCLHLPLITLDQWQQSRYCPEFIATMSVFGERLLGQDITHKFYEEMGVHFELVNIHEFKALLEAYQHDIMKNLLPLKESLKDLFHEIIQQKMDAQHDALKQRGLVNHFIALNQQGQVNQQIMDILLAERFQASYTSHIDDTWHAPEPLSSLVGQIYITIPQDLAIKPKLIDAHPRCTTTALLPIVLAWLSCQTQKTPKLDELASRLYREILAIRQIKSFDTHWFNDCFEMALSWFYYKHRTNLN